MRAHDQTMWKSVEVVMLSLIGVRIVQCHHAIMDNCEHAIIGVRVMQCHHALITNSWFSTFGPNFILVPISTL